MKFIVKGQGLEVLGGNVIAEGAVEFASFTLVCDASWDGYTRTVRFRRASSEEIYDVAGVVDGGVYYIPAEVLVRGSVYVSVLGVMGEHRISTTEFAGFFVEGTLASGKTPSVTPDAYAQYVAIVNEKCEDMTKASTLIKDSCDDAVAASSSAKDSEQRCVSSASTCAQYAEECRGAARSVSGAEDAMSAAVESVRDSVSRLLSHDHGLSVAENERVAAENARKASEEERARFENERQAAEQERCAAEAERVASERGRVAGESARETRIKELENEMLGVTDSIVLKGSAIIGKCVDSRVILNDAIGMKPVRFAVRGVTSAATNGNRTAPVVLTGTKSYTNVTYGGKNFIKYPYTVSVSPSNSGIEYEVLGDGGVRISRNTFGGEVNVELCSSKVSLKAGRYTVSGGTPECHVTVYDTSDMKNIAVSSGGEESFEIDSDVSAKVRIHIVECSEIETVIYPMLCPYTYDSNYAKWEETTERVSIPLELFSVPACYDTLILTQHGDKAKLEKKIQKYSFSGSEAITLVENGELTGYNIFSSPIASKYPAKNIVGAELSISGMCSHFSYSKDDGEGCWVNGENAYLKLDSTEFPDVSSVQAFLGREHDAGTPVEVLYLREKQSNQTYVYSKEILLKDGVNVIGTSKGLIELEYVRDTNSVFKEMNERLEKLAARVLEQEAKSE